jgi:hypothetical protein
VSDQTAAAMVDPNHYSQYHAYYRYFHCIIQLFYDIVLNLRSHLISSNICYPFVICKTSWMRKLCKIEINC